MLWIDNFVVRVCSVFCSSVQVPCVSGQRNGSAHQMMPLIPPRLTYVFVARRANHFPHATNPSAEQPKSFGFAQTYENPAALLQSPHGTWLAHTTLLCQRVRPFSIQSIYTDATVTMIFLLVSVFTSSRGVHQRGRFNKAAFIPV